MTFLTIALLAAVSVAFPRNGQRLPAVQRCYLIGAASAGETNVVVQGKSFPVCEGGAWTAMADVRAGRNVIAVASTSVVVTVAAPKPAAQPSGAATTNGVSQTAYPPLPGMAPTPKAHPAGRLPPDVTVVIDAGHGGTDCGAVSPHGWHEKDANLHVARSLQAILRARGYRVVMTREGDTFPALYERPQIARRNHADAFISIHHNAPPVDRDPSQIRYHAVYAWNDIGTHLARCVNARMKTALSPGLPDHGVLHANFAVTRNPEIPSCLVEVDFITSPAGERDSWSPARRETVALAIADGFTDWCVGKDEVRGSGQNDASTASAKADRSR